MKVVAIILTCLVALLLPATLATGQSGACTFSGTVYEDGVGVSDGTLVTAIVAGDEYYAYTPTGYGYSTYSLTVNPPEGKNYPDGTEVTFKVNGHVADQTASFLAGENFRLDLAASSTPTPTSWPSYVAIIALSIFALLAAGAAAYYFLPRRRGLRIIDGLKGTGNVSSEQPLPLATDAQGEVEPRHIGDDAKVAWVKNTALLASKSQIKQGDTGGEESDIPGLTTTEVALLASKSQIKQGDTGGEESNIPGLPTTEVAPQPEQDTSVQLENQKKAIADTQATVITVKEAAQKLGLDPSHVRRLLAKGEVKGKKVGDTWVVLSLDYERKRRPKGKRQLFEP